MCDDSFQLSGDNLQSLSESSDLITLHTSQELGLAFRCISASEPDQDARKFMQSNFSERDMPLRVFDTLHEQELAADVRRACSRHGSECTTAGLTQQLAVFGTPCDPFSKMRCERFSDGASAHASFNTSFEDLKSWLTRFNPGTCVMEQAEGFACALQSGCSEMPLDVFLGFDFAAATELLCCCSFAFLPGLGLVT